MQVVRTRRIRRSATHNPIQIKTAIQPPLQTQNESKPAVTSTPNPSPPTASTPPKNKGLLSQAKDYLWHAKDNFFQWLESDSSDSKESAAAAKYAHDEAARIRDEDNLNKTRLESTSDYDPKLETEQLVKNLEKLKVTSTVGKDGKIIFTVTKKDK